jgi:hypothetical protein
MYSAQHIVVNHLCSLVEIDISFFAFEWELCSGVFDLAFEPAVGSCGRNMWENYL